MARNLDICLKCERIRKFILPIACQEYYACNYQTKNPCVESKVKEEFESERVPENCKYKFEQMVMTNGKELENLQEV